MSQTFHPLHQQHAKGRSMRILVVCGAGASSTFVAVKLRSAARMRGDRCRGRAGQRQPAGVPRRRRRRSSSGRTSTRRSPPSASVPRRPAPPSPSFPPSRPPPSTATKALDLALERESGGTMRTRTGHPHRARTEGDGNMAERIITVGSAHGLHARPAKLFVEAVNKSGADGEAHEGGRQDRRRRQHPRRHLARHRSRRQDRAHHRRATTPRPCSTTWPRSWPRTTTPDHDRHRRAPRSPAPASARASPSARCCGCPHPLPEPADTAERPARPTRRSARVAAGGRRRRRRPARARGDGPAAPPRTCSRRRR